MNFDKEYTNISKYENKVSVVGLPQRIKENNLINVKNKKTSEINFLLFAGSQGSLDLLDIFKYIIKNLNKLSISKQIFFTIQAPLSKHLEIENLLKENNYKFEIKTFTMILMTY